MLNIHEFSRAELINELKEFQLTHRRSPLEAELPHIQYIYIHFGTLDNALKEADLLNVAPILPTAETITMKLKRFIDEHHRIPLFSEFELAVEAILVFTSWRQALIVAGVNRRAVPKYSRFELIQQIHEVFKKTGTTPRISAFNNKHSIKNEFGSWTDALNAAGFKTKLKSNIQNEDELLAPIRTFVFKYSRQPKVREITTNKILLKHFKTWKNVIEKAGFEWNPNRSYITEDSALVNEVKQNGIKQVKAFYDLNGYVPRIREIENPHELIKYFGSWNKVIEAANLPAFHFAGYPKQMYLDNIRAFYSEHKRPPFISEIKRSHRYREHFESWSEAIKEAGIPTTLPLTDEELIDEVLAYYKKHNKGPKFDDLEHGDILRYRYRTLLTVYKVARIPVEYKKTTWTPEDVKKNYTNWIEKNKRIPNRSDIEGDRTLCSRKKISSLLSCTFDDFIGSLSKQFPSRSEEFYYNISDKALLTRLKIALETLDVPTPDLFSAINFQYCPLPAYYLERFECSWSRLLELADVHHPVHDITQEETIEMFMNLIARRKKKPNSPTLKMEDYRLYYLIRLHFPSYAGFMRTIKDYQATLK